ncbi:hypothetical protein EV424DRAFT_1428576 [Suillus variegatus]|nr:hypothetical protein EV424DRAFT_1428576 [Suillus variegatus]
MPLFYIIATFRTAPCLTVGECHIDRNTDAGHERFATYVTSKTISHLNIPYRIFSWSWTNVRSAILTKQRLSPTLRRPASKATLERISEISTLPLSRSPSITSARSAPPSICTNLRTCPTSYCQSIQRAPSSVASWQGQMALVM